jgi:hypothetical protein
MKKSLLAIALSASLVFTGASVVSAATPEQKAVVKSCVEAAKAVKKAADSAARSELVTVVSSTTDKKVKKEAKKKYDAAQKANTKTFAKAVKNCKPKHKK